MLADHYAEIEGEMFAVVEIDKLDLNCYIPVGTGWGCFDWITENYGWDIDMFFKWAEFYSKLGECVESFDSVPDHMWQSSRR